MPRSKHGVSGGARHHITAAQVGRQLRAAFEPVPLGGSDDFADLLAQLDRAERSRLQVAAE